jgi:hypothetical protein
MHDVAPQPRTALARSASTTPRLPLHPRISTRDALGSRKYRKPNKTNDGVHFYSVQMNAPVDSALVVIPLEGRVLARRGISPSFAVPQTFPVRPMPDDVPQTFVAGGADFPSSPAFQISNSQFLVRLETAVTPRKQRAGVNSNRHFSEGMVRGNCVLPCIGNLLFLGGDQVSNRLHLRLENVPNSNKRKALLEF